MPSAGTWLERIRGLSLPGSVRIMNVCGGHERSISVAGLRTAIPKNIELVPGPGCPVCICPEEDVFEAIQLALNEDVILVAFGDMLRVPVNVPKREPRSLEQAKAAGADIRPIASPTEVVRIANENPDRMVVFFAAGFESRPQGDKGSRGDMPLGREESRHHGRGHLFVGEQVAGGNRVLGRGGRMEPQRLGTGEMRRAPRGIDRRELPVFDVRGAFCQAGDRLGRARTLLHEVEPARAKAWIGDVLARDRPDPGAGMGAAGRHRGRRGRDGNPEHTAFRATPDDRKGHFSVLANRNDGRHFDFHQPFRPCQSLDHQSGRDRKDAL